MSTAPTRSPEPRARLRYPTLTRLTIGTGCGWTATSLSSPPTPTTWPPAYRDLILTLDDILIEDGKVAPFSPTETSYAAMRRFANRSAPCRWNEGQLERSGAGRGAEGVEWDSQGSGWARCRPRAESLRSAQCVWLPLGVVDEQAAKHDIYRKPRSETWA